jgi:Coatomer epsilon subunit
VCAWWACQYSRVLISHLLPPTPHHTTPHHTTPHHTPPHHTTPHLLPQDAAYVYDELVDKYGGSALLLNGLAVAKVPILLSRTTPHFLIHCSLRHPCPSIALCGCVQMHQQQYEEAESYLQEALTKAPSDPDSLANLIVASQHLQRAPEVVAR